MLANEAIGHVESDIDELSDQMNEMTRRMLRIEEERQVSFFLWNFQNNFWWNFVFAKSFIFSPPYPAKSLYNA